MDTWGNTNIQNLYKIAFLCSQKCPADIILKSYDWAKTQRTEKNCIVCGNHSIIEKDVFNILLKGHQPLILVLARGIQKRWESPIKEAVENKRLLVLSPFDSSVKRITRENAEIRNREIIRLSDKLVIGYKSPNGQLDKLLKNHVYETL